MAEKKPGAINKEINEKGGLNFFLERRHNWCWLEIKCEYIKESWYFLLLGVLSFEIQSFVDYNIINIYQCLTADTVRDGTKHQPTCPLCVNLGS